MNQTRGQLTQRIIDKSKELLGYEIDVREFRLMPYLQYCLVNSMDLDPNKITSVEREILSKWKKAGHVSGGAMDLAITETFWGIMCELIWLGYVDLS